MGPGIVTLGSLPCATTGHPGKKLASGLKHTVPHDPGRSTTATITLETAIAGSVDNPNPRPQRKCIRLPPQGYRKADPFHVDLCTADRRPVFRDSRLADMVVRRLNT
jgi:hypothetical protein